MKSVTEFRDMLAHVATNTGVFSTIRPLRSQSTPSDVILKAQVGEGDSTDIFTPDARKIVDALLQVNAEALDICRRHEALGRVTDAVLLVEVATRQEVLDALVSIAQKNPENNQLHMRLVEIDDMLRILGEYASWVRGVMEPTLRLQQLRTGVSVSTPAPTLEPSSETTKAIIEAQGTHIPFNDLLK